MADMVRHSRGEAARDGGVVGQTITATATDAKTHGIFEFSAPRRWLAPRGNARGRGL